MGAHLHFKVVDPDTAPAANDFIDEQPEHEQLEDIGAQRLLFAETADEFSDKGNGQVKSSTPINDHDDVPGLWAALFEKLHDHDEFDVKVLASSCSLRLMTFTLNELNQLTDHGDAISGPNKQQYVEMLEAANSVSEFPTEFTAENTGVTLSESERDVLDVLLTFHTETFRVDMLEEHIPLSTDEIKKALAGLENKDIVIVDFDQFYRLNSKNERVDALRTQHYDTVTA